MKLNLLSKLAVLAAALALAGCAKPSDPARTPVTQSGTPTATSTAVQLQEAWTLINFGAPW
jgi:uncharacterized lipoprotein YajG